MCIYVPFKVSFVFTASLWLIPCDISGALHSFISIISPTGAMRCLMSASPLISIHSSDEMKRPILNWVHLVFDIMTGIWIFAGSTFSSFNTLQRDLDVLWRCWKALPLNLKVTTKAEIVTKECGWTSCN